MINAFHAKLLQDLPGVCNDLRRHNGPIAGTDFGNKMTAIGRTDESCPPSAMIPLMLCRSRMT